MPKLIQRTELKTFYYTPVHCPFCGVRVMGADPVDETRITACPHTLFIAHDTAFEYRSARLDEHLQLDGLSEQQVEARDLLVGRTRAERNAVPLVAERQRGEGISDHSHPKGAPRRKLRQWPRYEV